MKKLSIFLLLSLISLFSVAQSAEYKEMLKSLYDYSVPLIKPDQIREWMKSEKVYVLDTREAAEYKVSHLEGARRVGYDNFDLSSVDDIPKDAKVILYCSVGYRSEKVGAQLIQNGFQHVFNLYGGIFHWVNEGYDVYDDEGEVEKVHAYDQEWGKWVENEEVKKVY